MRTPEWPRRCFHLRGGRDKPRWAWWWCTVLPHAWAKNPGFYVIVRRTVSFIYPFVLVGAVVGPTRYVALAEGTGGAAPLLVRCLGWCCPWVHCCAGCVGRPRTRRGTLFNDGRRKAHRSFPSGDPSPPSACIRWPTTATCVAANDCTPPNALSATGWPWCRARRSHRFNDCSMLWAAAAGWAAGAVLALAPAFLWPRRRYGREGARGTLPLRTSPLCRAMPS